MSDADQTLFVDQFSICLNGDGEITGLVKIDGGELCFTLVDGRSWPVADVEMVHDDSGKFIRAILTATGEVLLDAGSLS